MALPIAANTTCDIYRNMNAPPAAPDVAGVAGYLKADYARRMETGEGDPLALAWTHILLVERTVDVRDGKGSAFSAFAMNDFVYIPDKNGTKFAVVHVERKNRGLSSDHLKVYLDRYQPTWPTNNL